jgi:hypothetical protein
VATGVLRIPGVWSPTLPQPEKRIGDEQPVTCTPPGKKKLRARSPFLIRRGPLDVIDHDVYRGNLRRDELNYGRQLEFPKRKNS